MSRQRLAAALVAAVLVIAAPGVLAAAETRIGLNGGRPSEWPFLSSVLADQGLTQEGWLDFASHVGENWLPGMTPVPLDYPGQLGIVSGPNALSANQSAAVGQQLLHELILDSLEDGPVAVAGLSEGTLVIERELAYLATLPTDDAPARDALTFYVFGDMLRGLGQMYLKGVTIPFIGQTFGPVAETQYDTVVVNEQWDGWANPPDRPWDLPAVFNALMGAVYTANGSNDHSQTSLDSLADAVKVSEITNTLGGTTTTYIVPRQQLPLTRPLRQLGVPGRVVDQIDRLLMPLIWAGYSSLTPDLGPHIENSQFVWNTSPGPITEPMATIKQIDVAPVQTGIASKGASSDSAAARTSPSADRAAALDHGSSLDRQLADATVDGGSVKDDPGTEAADPAQVASVVGSEDSDVSADVDATDASAKDDPEPGAAHRVRPARVRGPADSGDVGTTLEDDPKPVASHRARPGRIHGPADSDGTAGVGGHAKPGGAGEGATAGDAAPHAVGAAADG